MLFGEPDFLFLFLPLLLAAHFAAPRVLRNWIILLASVAFYMAGEGRYVLVMLGFIVWNFAMGLAVERTTAPRWRRAWLAIAVAGDLGCLGIYKYADFVVGNVNLLLAGCGVEPLPLPHMHLPIGISFFTFQAMSYVVDVYRQEVPANRNLVQFALYKSLFPQLIAGPIVRYQSVARQLAERQVTRECFAEGVRRFILGLGKKLIIADTVALAADRIFALPTAQLSCDVAWLGLICYTLQIYYDFAGYSEMAIGLGRMFGFRFPENFDYPYIAQSVGEFWRRWHISLSTWFRDYLYIPLGGSRCRPWRVYANLLIVFFLCGLWHGAQWNFVLWGLFHGTFLILERVGGAGAWLQQRHRLVRHGYMLLVVMVGWVLFRAETLGQAGAYLAALAGLASVPLAQSDLAFYLDNQLTLVLLLGILGSAPLLPWIVARWQDLVRRSGPMRDLLHVAGRAVGMGALMAELALSVMLSAAGTYSPFIYFRF